MMGLHCALRITLFIISFLIFSAYGLFLKAKEYGEKIIQDVVASWWMILLWVIYNIIFKYCFLHVSVLNFSFDKNLYQPCCPQNGQNPMEFWPFWSAVGLNKISVVLVKVSMFVIFFSRLFGQMLSDSLQNCHLRAFEM